MTDKEQIIQLYKEMYTATDHHKIYKGEICIYYFYAARTKDVP